MAYYQFELDQRSLYQVLGGLVVSLFLAFGAGLVVGLQLQLPEDLVAGSSVPTEQTEVTTKAPTEDDASLAPSDELTPDRRSERPGQRDDRQATGAKMNDSDDSRSAGLAEGGGGAPAEASVAGASVAEVSTKDSASDDRAPGMSAAVPSTAITAPYTIQLGSFGDRDKAQALASRVQRDDHTSVIKPERRNGKVVYRVWAGEYNGVSKATEKLDMFRQYSSGAFVKRTN